MFDTITKAKQYHISRRLYYNQFVKVERYSEAVKRTVQKLDSNYVVHKKQVQANH